MPYILEHFGTEIIFYCAVVPSNSIYSCLLETNRGSELCNFINVTLQQDTGTSKSRARSIPVCILRRQQLMDGSMHERVAGEHAHVGRGFWDLSSWLIPHTGCSTVRVAYPAYDVLVSYIFAVVENTSIYNFLSSEGCHFLLGIWFFC
ncbi:hypothetical protein GUJ93_ZPchr0013g37193 [Zizania palustris]|uniref:Uncharacterized protein n=1 Tax=Zizania palustris TaxID=103762 RepID=A0A8J5WXN9_ZIZPA|nr:hypothetical protein GUJ93_ZPchr0013g37193 [Zizania palustris]